SQACKQRAYRLRLSVTSSVTPSPAEVFRYVRHAEVPRFTAEGWELLPALDGTHHGEYSVLMRRVEQGGRFLGAEGGFGAPLFDGVAVAGQKVTHLGAFP